MIILCFHGQQWLFQDVTKTLNMFKCICKKTFSSFSVSRISWRNSQASYVQQIICHEQSKLYLRYSVQINQTEPRKSSRPYCEGRHQQAEQQWQWQSLSRRAAWRNNRMITASHVPNFINSNKLNNLRAARRIVICQDGGGTQRGVGEGSIALVQGDALDTGAISISKVGREFPAERLAVRHIFRAIVCQHADDFTQGLGKICNLEQTGKETWTLITPKGSVESCIYSTCFTFCVN